ncbi:hypothetical protein Mycsm_00257 [Mycobacterium sp. JS623]|uniref:hypothetical protein n=1 Tax=Mycobacterium sp. JS623 TaxID=212767 RepID=UPI0002A59C7C|nr:hypothetical protein [Mycobacterium sp. JS623]AGB20713.1 hypothetical protein Mycsm_00257 [Mycobacterium sp. JS623]
MSITDLSFAVLKIQYRLARLPLQLVDETVFGRMESDAPARLFFERSLGMLDVTIGNALRAPEFEQRGTALIARSDALRRAARLDAAASENIKAAGSNVRATREKADQEREDAHAEKESAVKNARVEAQNRKRDAVANAEKRIVSGKERADEAATARVGAVEAAKREELAISRAAEQNATAAADAKLEDAQDKRDTAASKVAQADRLAELADSEKERRS